MKILCAIDGSFASGKTIQALAEHEWPPGTTIRVLTVAEKVHPSAVELVATGQSPADLQRAVDSQCNVAASAAASKLQAAGVSSESETREGNPKSTIVEEAHRWGADLVVVGNKGGSALSQMLLGSVAQHVVANAPCSVLVVRHNDS